MNLFGKEHINDRETVGWVIAWGKGGSMRDFTRDLSWNLFAMTGNVDAYLLYKNCMEEDSFPDKEDEWEETVQKVDH